MAIVATRFSPSIFAATSPGASGVTPLEDLLLLDALPLRSVTSVEKLSVVAGLAQDSVRAGLGRLGLLGLAVPERGGWKRGKATG